MFGFKKKQDQTSSMMPNSSSKKKNNRKTIFIIIGIVIFIVLVFRVISTRNAGKANARQRITTVLVRSAQKSSMKRFLDLYGDLKAENEVEITAPVTGKVQSLIRIEGDTVGRGQSLMTIDRFEVGARFAPATVASPVNGVVTRILVNKGEDVTVGKALAVVGNPNIIEAVIRVPEASAAEVEVGQEVFFQSRSVGDKIFKGSIVRRDLSLDPSSRSLTVRAIITNQERTLFSGIYAESYIFVEEVTNVYVVPDSSITKTPDGKDAIYVNINNKAELRPVTISLRYRDQVAISEGINDNESLVVFGREYLSPGVAIRPLDEKTVNSNSAVGSDGEQS
ncbi:MAG: efflux RND transporter periplasmic adaptor subunit [Brevinema sp.]